MAPSGAYRQGRLLQPPGSLLVLNSPVFFRQNSEVEITAITAFGLEFHPCHQAA